MKRSIKKVVAIAIAAASMISLLPAADAAAAAPKLSAKTVKLTAGSKKLVKIKNSSAKAKVTWKCNNTKVARITKKVTKGKNASATILAVAKGNAKVTASYKLKGKVKKLTCTVKVSAKEENVVKATQSPVINSNPTNSPAVNPTAVPTSLPTATPVATATPTPTAKVITANEAALNKSPDASYNQKNSSIEDYGSFQTISYDSNITNTKRQANVFLPADYDENDEDTKYPVVYFLHGIAMWRNSFGSSIDCSTAYIAGNAIEAGLCKKFILVCPDIRVSTTKETDNPDPDNPNEMRTHSVANYKLYDLFREELIDNLMPYMEENFHVATGRENTGVCGFSMGGREGLYIGLSRPDLFGYVGGFCPAVGLLDYERAGAVAMGEDSLFGADENLTLPAEYINNTFVEIFAGSNDTVVNKEPLRYKNALEANNVPVLYAEVPYGHEARTFEPGLYNFIINAFAAEK